MFLRAALLGYTLWYIDIQSWGSALNTNDVDLVRLVFLYNMYYFIK